jgi:hypothetical protein
MVGLSVRRRVSLIMSGWRVLRLDCLPQRILIYPSAYRRFMARAVVSSLKRYVMCKKKIILARDG